MSKTASFLSVAGIKLSRNVSQPLHRQLYSELRRCILTGQLAPGMRLPPTRALSDELGLSRSTVVDAIEQLAAEGYVEGKVGAGTYVCVDLPESMLTVPIPTNGAASKANVERTSLSRRGQQLISDLPHNDCSARPFRSGVPETLLFPFGIWRKLLNKHWRQPTSDILSYGEEGGYLPLREAIADYVRSARGVTCTPEQVIIVAGAQQALQLATYLLTDPGDPVWIENPGYAGTRTAFRAANTLMTPVPIDDEGMMVEHGIAHCPDARMVYVCPSHQYPLGATLSLTRRMQLLQWAQAKNAWILEDDYDSEFRYIGHPLASLQGLDNAGRVIYIGTFSKVLFPALRLGYMIVPFGLSQSFAIARTQLDRGSPWMPQMVLNDFIREGHFARHIRRMRTLYMERQKLFIEAIHEDCDGWLEVKQAPAGLHLLGWLPVGVDDLTVSMALNEVGIETPPLSSYSLTPLARGGLVMGYSALNEETIRAGVKRMADRIHQIGLINR
ncbi:PLP-dependent aminotransferase family protein [Chloroflexi bacterium TSY]|nr:PLP-dependent aminotransferase family protein [Chloroflexi bacterium TSY]